MSKSNFFFELYFSDLDLESQKVLQYLRENRIEFVGKDVSSDIVHLQKLYLMSGKKDVPCLFVNGEIFEGAADILVFLELYMKMYSSLSE